MVTSRGGISGGLSIADALREFEARGYVGQFAIVEGGEVKCNACGHAHQPADVSLDAMRRVEGVSDPADMLFIGALQCPHCGARGTAIVNYGTLAQPDDAAALRGFEDQLPRPAHEHDDALVSDTGWLKGPDG